MPYERLLDDEPLSEGTHGGATGLTFFKQGADFKSCGVKAGLYVENTTDGSSGLVTAVTEETVTTTLSGGALNTWTSGDEFEIYKTATKDSRLSSIFVDKRFGHKASSRSELTGDNLFPEDVDLDEHNENVFGPGQPARAR